MATPHMVYFHRQLKVHFEFFDQSGPSPKRQQEASRFRRGNFLCRARCGNPGDSPSKIVQLVRESRRPRHPWKGILCASPAPELVGSLAASRSG